VEYRKSGKLVERLNELTAAQAEKAMAVSNRRADGGQFGRIVEQRVSKAPKPLSYRAPHIQHYGVEHGLQRYRCAGWAVLSTLSPANCWHGCARRRAGLPSPTRLSNRQAKAAGDRRYHICCSTLLNSTLIYGRAPALAHSVAGVPGGVRFSCGRMLSTVL
jgi:hypothetical protein